MNTRINLELALILNDTTFSKRDMENWYEHIYRKGSTVREETYRKFGDLSDDGFYELTKEGGGDFDWDEIYDTGWKLSNHYPFDGEEFLLCPTLYEVQSYLRNTHKIHITIYSYSQESWQYRITKPKQKLEDGYFGEDFSTYEDALSYAIKFSLTNIIF